MAGKDLSGLVIKSQSGDSSAVNQLFNSCYNDIYYFALKTVKNEDAAYDITQDVCVTIFKEINSLKDPSAFVSWSRQITYHQCTKYFKKNREVLVDENEDGDDVFDVVEDNDTDFIPAEALDREDFRKTIMSMIENLSEEQRTAVLLYYFDELSVSEIAKIQGVSEGTVKSRLNYARKAIKASVNEYEEKNGVKLHSVGVLPLLLWLFSGDKAASPMSTILQESLAQSVASAAGSVGATTAATTTAATTTAATTTAATTAAGAAATGVAIKVVSIIAAISVAVGGGIFGLKKYQENKKDYDAQLAVQDDSTAAISSETESTTLEQTTEPTTPLDYISDVFEPYGQQLDFKDLFVKFLDNVAGSFLTSDGNFYSTSDATQPYFTVPLAETVNCFGGKISYRDEKGDIIIKDENLTFSLSNCIGEPVYAQSVLGTFGMITKTEDNRAFFNYYDTDTGEQSCENWPVAIIDNETQEEHFNIEYFEYQYDAMASTIYAVADGQCYKCTYDIIGSGRVNSKDGKFVIYGNKVSNEIDRVVSYGFQGDGNSPYYTKAGVTDKVFWYKESYFSNSENYYTLPEGYTASQVEEVIPAYHTPLIRFDDGSVFLINSGFENGYKKLEKLSQICAAGHVKQIFLPGQSLLSSSCDVIVLLDDNGLYKYNDYS